MTIELHLNEQVRVLQVRMGGHRGCILEIENSIIGKHFILEMKIKLFKHWGENQKGS